MVPPGNVCAVQREMELLFFFSTRKFSGEFKPGIVSQDPFPAVPSLQWFIDFLIHSDLSQLCPFYDFFHTKTTFFLFKTLNNTRVFHTWTTFLSLQQFAYRAPQKCLYQQIDTSSSLKPTCNFREKINFVALTDGCKAFVTKMLLVLSSSSIPIINCQETGGNYRTLISNVDLFAFFFLYFC